MATTTFDEMRGVTTDLSQLVSELDEMLPGIAGAKEGDDIVIIADRKRSVPTWAALVLITAALVAIGWALVQPLASPCGYSEAVCAVQDLDFDALLATSPEAALFDAVPPVDVLDPDDELTLGEVFAQLDQHTDLSPEELITSDQLQRLLEPNG